jgi:cytochrome c oxidase subunit 4
MAEQHGPEHAPRAVSAVVPREHPHPGAATYVKVALVLAVLTAIEVSVVYIETVRPALTPTLLVLSASKFALVALFYMHLKFDSRLFSSLFVAGLLLAGVITIAMLVPAISAM